MPATDRCADAIIRVFQKDGWSITSDIYLDDTHPTYIDIEATRSSSNGQSLRHFYGEIKCFHGHNSTQELYIALGQYILYRAQIAQAGLSVPLYLIAPRHRAEIIFDTTVVRTFRDNGIKIIVVDIEEERVVAWTE
jgi:hypothetical protein